MGHSKDSLSLMSAASAGWLEPWRLESSEASFVCISGSRCCLDSKCQWPRSTGAPLSTWSLHLGLCFEREQQVATGLF